MGCCRKYTHWEEKIREIELFLLLCFTKISWIWFITKISRNQGRYIILTNLTNKFYDTAMLLRRIPVCAYFIIFSSVNNRNGLVMYHFWPTSTFIMNSLILKNFSSFFLQKQKLLALSENLTDQVYNYYDYIFGNIVCCVRGKK